MSEAIAVSVVLPVFKTGPVVDELYRRLRDTLEGAGLTFELLFIDDGSPDDAWSAIQRIGAADGRVRGFRLSRNFGQHAAIAAGFERARGDAIVLMDADLQDAPEEIPRLVRSLSDDVDVVYTVKHGEHEPLLVRLTSRLYHTVFSGIAGADVPRNIGTYRAFSARVLDALQQYPERAILYGPLMFLGGFRSTIVEVERKARPQGRSAYTFRKRLSLAVGSLLAYTDLPHRALMSLGSLLVAAASVYAVLILVRYAVTSTTAFPGLSLMAMLVTVTAGSTMFGLGIIGTYVFRAYQEVLGRPRFHIGSTTRADDDDFRRRRAPPPAQSEVP